MIARVRIALVEQWCEFVTADMPSNAALIVGMEVDILTETCCGKIREEMCEGKRWIMERASQAKVDTIIEGRLRISQSWWCEHMLEMD